MVFVIESIALCIVFSILAAAPIIKNPLSRIHQYPPKIIDRAKELGLITDQQAPRSKRVIAKKGIGALLIAVVLALILVYVNKAGTFWEGFYLSYALWLVVDWFDAIILDCVWFCHSKRAMIPGTEDMTDEYHNYMFHIKASLSGMLIGLPVCILVGGLVAVIA
jgi:hypothetical protein